MFHGSHTTQSFTECLSTAKTCIDWDVILLGGDLYTQWCRTYPNTKLGPSRVRLIRWWRDGGGLSPRAGPRMKD